METTALLMEKITKLARMRQLPLIFLENPKFMSEMLTKQTSYEPQLIAAIGPAACKFETFSISDLTEVYASLRSQLERMEPVAQDPEPEPEEEAEKASGAV